MNAIEPEVITSEVHFTVWEWIFFIVVGLILIGIASLVFHVFGFVIGLFLVMLAYRWLEEKG